jgi:NAD(P)-dependent dehydrogenase (short-subunit alcohol dehydrogenase family)
MNGEFAGKVVVVSGASRGIGRGIAQAFASCGAQTVLAASSRSNLDAAVALIGACASGRPPDSVVSDLRAVEGCETVFKYVADRYGRCDILVNSAGAARAGAFTKLDDEAWLDGFALKFFGCVRLCRLFWPMLVAAKGHVVNIIGGAARTPDPESMIGGAVNAAMNNFSKSLSGQGKREGVNVNAILPGMTAT